MTGSRSEPGVGADSTHRPPRWRALGVEMDTHSFRRLLGLIDTLGGEQRAQLTLHLAAGGGEQAVSVIVEGRLEALPTCPRCLGSHIVRHGHADGLQRYKCRACGRTFNALTGTPLARLRQREKWLAQARALEEGWSVRRAAAHMGVHRTTAFRWRHRFLTRPATARASALAGVAEADETYTLRSYKGQRRRLQAEQSRAPRRRGGKAAKRGLSDEQVPILVLRDRSGQTADFVLERDDACHIEPLLAQTLADDALLCTDASAALAAAAKARHLEHHAVNTARGERRRGPWHIQNVNAYHSRWKMWMVRFHGVATSYLDHYLGWFRALDRNAQSGAPTASLLALAIAT
jgi:transposase-like protein